MKISFYISSTGGISLENSPISRNIVPSKIYADYNVESKGDVGRERSHSLLGVKYGNEKMYGNATPT